MRKGGRGVKRSIMVYGSTMICNMLLHLCVHVYDVHISRNKNDVLKSATDAARTRTTTTSK